MHESKEGGARGREGADIRKENIRGGKERLQIIEERRARERGRPLIRESASSLCRVGANTSM